ncbi:MAG: galactitol-1-phosphate 5-dehydrogenase [Pirellulales bacterium]
MIPEIRRLTPYNFMQALLLTEYRHLQLTDLARPAVGPRDVLVRVAACGICGSDVHGYDGSTGRRIPPLVMGHEAAGVIAEVGDAVDHARIGQRVTFDSTISCGHCDSCRHGKINLCTERRILGVSCDEFRQNGAFAEFVAVPEHILYALPEGMPLEHAAFIEPVSVAVHAVDRLHFSRGDRAVVVGSGMIGLLVIQALYLKGCEDVVAIDVDNGRLQLARELGASTTINSRETEAVAAVLEQTAGRGADIAMEIVGNNSAMALAIGCVRRGGQVVLVGNASPEVSLPLQVVVARELTLLGSCASAGEYPRAIDLVANGSIRVAPLISAIAPLADGPHWFERLYNREPGLMKVILRPA